METENVVPADDFGPPDPEKLLKSIKIGLPGQDYLTYEIELTGIPPGILMNKLDPEILSFPGVTSRNRAPKGDVAGTVGEKPARGKKRAAEPVAGATNIVAEGDNVAGIDSSAAFRVARGVAYFMPDSNILCCPAENLQSMLIAAGKSWEKSGLDRTAGACIMFEDYNVQFTDPVTGDPLVFDQRAIMTTNQYHASYASNVCYLVKAAKSSNRKRILTSRVFLPQWRLTFRVRYDASMITSRAAEGVVKTHLWIYAGGYIGQMSWRPGAPFGPGPFGRYQVTGYRRIT